MTTARAGSSEGRVVAVLATLDTKGAEADYLRRQIEALGGRALLIDMGLVGAPGTTPDVTREEVAAAGGRPLRELLRSPTRDEASPVFVAGATKILQARIAAGSVHAVLGLGGTQGTSNATAVMRALPYGFPKVMLSTVASGDVSAFVDIKDVTMMFSVGDILGLNPLLRKMLANAAAAAWGMACSPVTLDTVKPGPPRDPVKGDRAPGPTKQQRATQGDHAVAPAGRARATGSARGVPPRPLIGMTNLGTLTTGALHALRRFEQRGYEVIVFHAVGSGGRAMEQMMKEGLIGAVFDYALGEISDELFGGLRAASPERLTVAGRLGLPQVICPGGAEHVGLLVAPHTIPERWQAHKHVFHNPIIAAPRLDPDEFVTVAREIGRRLAHTKGRAAFFMPMGGTSRYGIPGGPLHDPAGDEAFLAALRSSLPASVELVVRDEAAEDPAFVDAAVDKLVELIEARQAG